MNHPPFGLSLSKPRFPIILSMLKDKLRTNGFF